jgi:phosphatidylethanolamine-binding protein (PEBP) family uncharacterized protein
LISVILNIISSVNSVSRKLQRRDIRKLLLVAVGWMLLGITLYGQAVGDYESVANGSWSSLSSWKRWDGGNWVAPTPAQGYPGYTNSNPRVDINNNITLDLSPANPVGNLYVNSGTLELSAYNFTVNGITNVSGTLSDIDVLGIVVFHGTITISNSATWTSVSNSSSNLLFYGNIINNSNNVSVARARAAASIVLSGIGSMTMDYFEFNSAFTITNQTTITVNFGINAVNNPGTQWINQGTLNYASTSFLLMRTNGVLDASATGNTINYSGAGDQDIKVPSSGYYNLGTSGGGTKTLSGDITVAGTLTMTSGNIATGSNTLILSNSSAAALNYISGTVIGKIKRGINTPGVDYLFPVGTSSYYHPAIFNFSTLSSATNITGQFVESDPGSFTPYVDGTSQLNNAFNDGYWNFSSSSVPTNLYSLSLNGNGFSSYSIDTGTRISGRNSGSPAWQAFGAHGSFIPSFTITRTGINNLNTTSFDYCFAAGCNSTANAGNDVAICKGSSTTLNGSGGGTYSWSPTGGLSNPNIANPVATPTATTTYTLTVTNGGCVSTDDVLVTVNPYPAVVLGYAFQKTITLDGSKVAGTNTNFPVLIHLIDNDLKNNVLDPNGYDIIFSDINYNKLDHDLESYNPATGELFAWVRVPTLSNGINSQIRIFYGNPQIVTNQSSAATWDSGFSGIWHLNNNYLDASSSGNNGTNNGTTNVPGKIADGGNFAVATDYISIGTTNWSASSGTFETWINSNSAAGADPRYIFGHTTVPAFNNRLQLYVQENTSDLGLGIGNSHYQQTGIVTLANNTWYHVAVVWNGTNYTVYVNGVSVVTNSYTGFGSLNPFADIGNDGDITFRNEGFLGIIDEVRVSNIVRSSSWIQTEYNNQNNPSGFIQGISDQTTCSAYSFKVCENSTGVIYSVPNQTGNTYNWTITGSSGFTGQLTNQVSVNWGPAGTGNISLSVTNSSSGCSATSPIYSVIKNPDPTPSINGNLNVCPNKTGDIYSTPNIVGHSYIWSVTGAISFSGNGTNQISVDWGPGPAGTVSVTETIDAIGCSALANLNVNIVDNTPPTITCPGNISKNDDTGACNASVIVPNAIIADNCSVATLTWTMTGSTSATSPAGGINQIGTYTFNTGVTTVTYVVKDAVGNQATCNFTVTITDNINPTITCPGNITHTADAGLCSYTVNPGVPTTGDNCGVSGVVGTRSDALLLTAPYPVGVTTIHWVVTDIHGNTSSCDQTVTVTDDEKPTISCPANITHTADAGLCSYTVNPGVPTTGDNCGVSGVVGTRSDALLLTAPYPVGVTTIHWVVTDIHGNINSCDQTVTVTDDEKPTITCPANITHTADAGLCSYTVNPGVPTTGDNCGVSGVVGTRSDALLLTAPYPVGVTTIHWVVTDIHGNTSSCDQTVTVTDDEKPTITCPGNITHTADAGLCSYTVSVGAPTTGDNCGVSGVVGTRSDALLLTAPYPVGVTTIHWVVTDIHGNTSSCDQTVTVTDDEKPTITCPGNITHTADAGLCSYTVNPGVPTTGDNCGVSGVVGTRSDALLLTAPYPVGVTTIHWVVTDIHGNTNSCDQTVTVTDDEKPTITCPANITHTADAGLCSYTVNPGVPTTGDNCGVSGVVGTRSDALLLTAPYPVGVTTIHWVVTDIHGNTNSCDQTVTVTDDEKPTITCPANITHTADAGLCSYTVNPGVPTTGDNCGVSGVVGTRSDALLLTAPYPVGVTTIHWVVTDIHGNTSSCDQTVTVTDDEKPTITCPGNITHTADAGLCSYTVNPGVPTTGDNCGVSGVVGTRSDALLLTAPYPVGVTTIHWVVTDIHGNISSCDQTVTVTDDEKPTITVREISHIRQMQDYVPIQSR